VLAQAAYLDVAVDPREEAAGDELGFDTHVYAKGFFCGGACARRGERRDIKGAAVMPLFEAEERCPVKVVAWEE
jgi:hypothetical protein